MIFPEWLKVYGDQEYRGPCPQETVEQVSIINQIRKAHPCTYGRVATHIRNEGKRTFNQAIRHKADGLVKGAPDLIIPGMVTFICEIKRKNHTLSRWQDGQLEYLETAQKIGAWVCVALGAEAAWQAFEDWRKDNEIQT